ncbi:alginate lyase family protein [Jiangella aurantiaca]|nr:alginate lyase family protein [Jiangella aurantiaca]
MRTQVLAGVEPWASYYDAMTQTRYAAADFKASIQGPTDEQPTSTAYDNASMRSRQHTDSIGAMTQALMYLVTGDELFRANALHIIRTWSSLDPTQYQYFPDAHIHTGVPLYQTLVAAEIIRSTEPVHDELDGYDLRWTGRDEQRIESNLIRPVLDTFLYSQNRLWNQHLYGVIGMVAAAIFLDDPELYAERVEWFTVNSTYQSEHTINGGDVNGSLAAIIRTIDADDPLNTYGEDFLQVMEMGRDQAHAEGDIDLLTALARIVNNQGTRVDPLDGTVSTEPDAVSPYEFLDNRILAGGDVFAAFMMGEELPWVDTSGGSGKVAEAYRGRLREPLNELYYQYKYIADVDVETEAPHVAELYEHRDGPLFYYGSSVSNFWNERGSDFTGAEYWVAFPPELAEQDITVPAAGDGPELPLERFGHTLGQGAKHKLDAAGEAFVRLDAKKDDARVAVRRVVWADRTRTALVGVQVRTNGTAILEAARTSNAEPFTTVQLPDTHGRWRYVWFDVDSSKVPSVGDNIVFFRATGGRAHVDVAAVLADANGALTPPVFDDGASLDVVAVAGEPYTRTFGVTDSAGNDVSLELQDAPKGAELSDDGTLTWLPSKKQDRGGHDLVVVASDEQTDTALPVTITVAPDRLAAIDALLAGLDASSSYTTSTWRPVVEAREAASAAAENAGPAEFADLLEDLRLRIDGLELLNPRLSDGTLDFSGLVTSPDLSPAKLAILVDEDNQTFWGDIRRPSVLLDFGAGYRFRADAFGWLARDTFPDRSHGANAYGSNDGTTWTLLTEHVTEGNDVAIETIAVRDEVRDSRFRYLKLQVDEPQGPGIFSMADIRIHGERTEAGLETVVHYARSLDPEDFTATSWAAFDAEITAVEDVMDEPGADKESLIKRVLDAYDLLVAVYRDSFEASDPDVWAPNGSAPSTYTRTIDDSYGRSGTRSLHFTSTDTTYSGSHNLWFRSNKSGSPVMVAPHTTYKVSFWYQLTDYEYGSGLGAYYFIRSYSGGSGVGSDQRNWIRAEDTEPGEWRYFEREYTTEGGSVNNVVIDFGFRGSSGEFRVDDLRVEPA